MGKGLAIMSFTAIDQVADGDDDGRQRQQAQVNSL
jgi:hypothetical protein